MSKKSCLLFIIDKDTYEGDKHPIIVLKRTAAGSLKELKEGTICYDDEKAFEDVEEVAEHLIDSGFYPAAFDPDGVMDTDYDFIYELSKPNAEDVNEDSRWVLKEIEDEDIEEIYAHYNEENDDEDCDEDDGCDCDDCNHEEVEDEGKSWFRVEE